MYEVPFRMCLDLYRYVLKKIIPIFDFQTILKFLKILKNSIKFYKILKLQDLDQDFVMAVNIRKMDLFVWKNVLMANGTIGASARNAIPTASEAARDLKIRSDHMDARLVKKQSAMLTMR
jgi:hypothetical protein